MARPCALSAGARSDQGASDSPLPVRRPGRPSTPEGLGERLLDGWRDGYGDGGEGPSPLPCDVTLEPPGPTSQQPSHP